MIHACLFLLAGIYALQLSSFVPDSDPLAGPIVALFVALLRRQVCGLFFIVCGVALFAIAVTSIIDTRIATKFVGDSIVTQVRIVDFPKQSGLNVSLVAENLDNSNLPRRIRVSWYQPPVKIRLGDVWQLELRLRRPRGSSNPGVFDYEAWLLRERVGAVAYVVDSHRNSRLRTGDLYAVEQVRQRVVDRLTTVIKDTENAAVLAAISVGARHLLTAEQWQKYARTGTSHLMAISGLHVGMAAAGGYYLVALSIGVLRLRQNQHFVATIAAVCVAASYALLSGFAVPAQRASLMIAMVAVSILCRRQIRPFTTIATAAALIALVSPLAPMAPGFKLSFSAVLILIWLAQRYQGDMAGKRLLRPIIALRRLGSLQVLLLLGLLPLTVLIFGRIALAAPLVNLIAVPLFSAVTVPLTLAGLLLDGPLHWFGDRVLIVAASSLGLIKTLINWAASWPAADVSVAAVSGCAWMLIAAPLFWVILPPGWPGRTLALPAIVALSFYQPPRPPVGCADIDVLDVGQGLSVVVSTRRHVLLFDTGPSYRGGGNAVESVVMPFLASRGIKRIDLLVVSHADLDHSGGVESLITGIDVLDIRVGERLDREAHTAQTCKAGESWYRDGVGFSFIHPPADSAHKGNDASCVLLLEAGVYRLLMTGDIERQVEADLVRAGELPDVEAVIIPHHGSRTSSSLAFVRALSPQIAVASAGFDNRWGFPKGDVVRRWQEAGAAVYATATSGAIGMRLCDEGGLVSLTQNRVQERRIWHE
jgi:competence protein ComEC